MYSRGVLRCHSGVTEGKAPLLTCFPLFIFILSSLIYSPTGHSLENHNRIHRVIIIFYNNVCDSSLNPGYKVQKSKKTFGSSDKQHKTRIKRLPIKTLKLNNIRKKCLKKRFKRHDLLRAVTNLFVEQKCNFRSEKSLPFTRFSPPNCHLIRGTTLIMRRTSVINWLSHVCTESPGSTGSSFLGSKSL